MCFFLCFFYHYSLILEFLESIQMYLENIHFQCFLNLNRNGSTNLEGTLAHDDKVVVHQ